MWASAAAPAGYQQPAVQPLLQQPQLQQPLVQSQLQQQQLQQLQAQPQALTQMSSVAQSQPVAQPQPAAQLQPVTQQQSLVQPQSWQANVTGGIAYQQSSAPSNSMMPPKVQNSTMQISLPTQATAAATAPQPLAASSPLAGAAQQPPVIAPQLQPRVVMRSAVPPRGSWVGSPHAADSALSPTATSAAPLAFAGQVPAGVPAISAVGASVKVPNGTTFVELAPRFVPIAPTPHIVLEQGVEGTYGSFQPKFNSYEGLEPLEYQNGQYVDPQYGEFADGVHYADLQLQQYVDNQQYPATLPAYAPYAATPSALFDEVGADEAAGMPRGLGMQDKLGGSAGMVSIDPMAAGEDDGSGQDQFTRLLNSLEARVDLMAQMQHTRAQIQKHTRTLQGTTMKLQNKSSGGSPSAASKPLMLPGLTPRDRQQPFSDGGRVGGWGQGGSDVASTAGSGAGVLESTGGSALSRMGGYSASQPVAEVPQAEEPIAAKLARENAMLWSQFADQRDHITRLTGEVEGMRSQIRALSVEPAVRGSSIDRTSLDRRGVEEAASALLAGVPGRNRTGGLPMVSLPGGGGYQPTGEEALPTTGGDAAATAFAAAAYPGGSGEVEDPQARLSDPLSNSQQRQDIEAQLHDALSASQRRRDIEVKNIEMRLQEERKRQESSTEQWYQERRHLLDELNVLRGSVNQNRRKAGQLPTVGESSEGLMGGVDMFALTTPVLPAYGGGLAGNNHNPGDNLAGNPGGPDLPGPLLAPLSRHLCGINIEMSEDGYAARRTKGCRQSVVVGSAPLERQDEGWYFEVLVKETVNGWVGGLGIGVTRVAPTELKRMPDKAWRIPNTFIVGYWGCVFLDGRERRTKWKADSLREGQRVGLLVTGDGRGDLIVFVDGKPVVRADDVLPCAVGMPAEPLYPVMDVFAATLCVELQRRAKAPQQPWGQDPSPPGSPASVARSMNSSTLAIPVRGSVSVT